MVVHTDIYLLKEVCVNIGDLLCTSFWVPRLECKSEQKDVVLAYGYLKAS